MRPAHRYRWRSSTGAPPVTPRTPESKGWSGASSSLAGLCIGIVLAAAAIAWIGDGNGIFRFRDTPSPGPSHSAGSSGFPLTKRDALGYEVTLLRPPMSIASQALTADHLLFAVVPPSRIVGISPYASEPHYSNIRKDVLAMGLPTVVDPESVLAIRPDLLVSSHIANPDYLRLIRASGTPVYAMQTTFATLDEIPVALRLVGELTGERASAERAASEFEAALARIRGGVPERARNQRVLGFSSYRTAYGSGSLFDDIVTALGAVNVAADHGLGPWGNIGPEQIVTWNPDWIVTSTGGRPAERARAALAEDDAVALTTAGQLGQLVVVEDRYFMSMSQHVLELVRAVADALNGGLDSNR